MSMKSSNDTIGNRTSDLPVCSVVIICAVSIMVGDVKCSLVVRLAYVSTEVPLLVTMCLEIKCGAITS